VTEPSGEYDDGLVQLDRHAITLRRYHFPSGTSKVIPLRAIRGYKTESLGLLVQRFRIWGSSDLVTLDVPGSRPAPAFTPARPQEFLTLFEELLGP
jgi:hypothetical protein